MTELLLFVIIGMLLYMMDILKKLKTEDKKENKKFSYKDVLPDYKNKKCEIAVKTPMPGIDVMLNVQGTIEDFDESWVAISTENKKKSSIKIIRVENIAGIKEFV